MAKFSIAFDDRDTVLGSYFELSKNDISSFIINHNIDHLINEIPTVLCNQAYVDFYFPGINSSNFLFVAYCHGNDNYLAANATWYISSPDNTQNFANSLFYSMACSSGRVMGPELIEKGCLAFVGYNDESFALNGKYQQLSIDCDNRALKKFMEGLTIGEAVLDMKDFLSQSIKTLLSSGEILVASYLRRNLAALVIHGNTKLTFNDFN